MTTTEQGGVAPPAATLRRRPLVLMLVAHYLSAFGNAVTVVTVPLYVFGQTGSSVSTGLAGFANALPLVFAGAVGGVWIDRIGGQRMSVVSDLLAGALIGLVPLLNDTVGLPLPALMLLLFGRSMVATPASAARMTLVKPLADEAGVRLENANSWIQGAPRLGLLVGAPLAGLLIATTGPVVGMYVDCASFFAAALLMSLGVPRRAPQPAAERPPFFRQLSDGLTATRKIPVIAAMTGFVVVTNFLDDAFTPVLLPVYSEEVLGGGQYLGWLLAASGCGAVAGTFLYGPASKRLLTSRRWTLLGCFAVIGVLRLCVAAEPGPVLTIVISFLLGLAAGPLNPVLMTVMFERVPPELTGRIFALSGAAAMSAAPLGILVAGWSVDLAGLRTTLIAFGCAYLVLIAVSSRLSALKDMDKGPDAADAAPAPAKETAP
ncbi:MFS transporter [Streptomyces sp. NPDC001941]|uniref:MFS transporter n=1 Tax=Streptomyces sp. NPDC001941 TaxID=3154659 RepID=UPI0033178088